MEGSTFAQLRAAARGEAKKLSSLNPAPTRYLFVTSKSLTAANKGELRSVLTPWIAADGDVIGAEDLEILLNAHPEVERRHVKLWLTSAAQLDQAVNTAIWKRSRQMLDELTDALPRFVDTGVFETASRRLYDEKALVLSGAPGIGKTTVARMLVAEAVAEGFEPIEVSTDIEEAYAVVDSQVRQIFLYDDFLGATFLQDRLIKNEDKRLASFIRRCRASKNTLFVLTTREHILRQATAWYDELDRVDLPIRRLLVELKSYSRRERGLILYNHLYHSGALSSREKQSILRDGGYLKIIDHPNYNPRIIEHATGALANFSQDQTLLSNVLDNLDNPDRVWNHAFRNQLDDDARDIVLLLSTMPAAISLEELEPAFDMLAASRERQQRAGAVLSALATLDDSFTRSTHRYRRSTEVSIADPSVADFVGNWIASNPSEAVRLGSSAIYFEQLDWLSTQLARSSPRNERLLLEELREAVMRTFSTPPLSRPGGPITARWFSAHRAARGPEGRLLFAMGLADAGPPSRSTSRYHEWMRVEISRLSTAWNRGVTSDLETAIDLVVELFERGHLSPDTRAGATRIALEAHTREQWDAVVNVLDDAPDALDIGSDQLEQRFDEWVSTLLTYSLEEVADEEELAELERVAERVGLSTLDSMWLDAYEAVRNRPDESEEVTRPPAQQSVLADADDIELRRLFERLRVAK
ncbi:MAG: hypothetical protein NT132_04505 [Microbacterium sp.]|uniref:nSTAND3 domain-containing NTPase n=1 Tax=Microbacterium sp. TaxID=51671 RepID=UPI002614F675|nr:hypothetical protein [Microbacterium sp.]MCX6501659.1 hypothetical protein [Microbacterium sp.]